MASVLDADFWPPSALDLPESEDDAASCDATAWAGRGPPSMAVAGGGAPATAWRWKWRTAAGSSLRMGFGGSRMSGGGS